MELRRPTARRRPRRPLPSLLPPPPPIWATVHYASLALSELPTRPRKVVLSPGSCCSLLLPLVAAGYPRLASLGGRHAFCSEITSLLPSHTRPPVPPGPPRLAFLLEVLPPAPSTREQAGTARPRASLARTATYCIKSQSSTRVETVVYHLVRPRSCSASDLAPRASDASLACHPAEHDSLRQCQLALAPNSSAVELLGQVQACAQTPLPLARAALEPLSPSR